MASPSVWSSPLSLQSTVTRSLHTRFSICATHTTFIDWIYYLVYLATSTNTFFNTIRSSRWPDRHEAGTQKPFWQKIPKLHVKKHKQCSLSFSYVIHINTHFYWTRQGTSCFSRCYQPVFMVKIISTLFPRERKEHRMLINGSSIVMISYIYIASAIPEQFTNSIHKRVTLPVLEIPPSLSWRLGSKQTVGKEQKGDQQGKENFGWKFIDLGNSVSYGKKTPQHCGIIKLPIEQRTLVLSKKLWSYKKLLGT